MATQKSFPTSVIFLLLMMIASSSATYMSKDPKPSSRSDHEIMSLFEKWMVEHNKVYNALGEKQKRFEIFKDNLMFINEQKAKAESIPVGLNIFADLTLEEFTSMYLSDFPDVPFNVSMEENPQHVGASLPVYVDWRNYGAVTPIKNQGRCPCCWAFSGIASVESLNKLVTGQLYSLSEQEIVDCEGHGCSPGFVEWVYDFIIRNRGITTDQDYPYVGKQQSCDRVKLNNRVVSIDGYRRIQQNERQLQAVVAYQPVSVGLSSGSREFQNYDGTGVFKDPSNCGTKIDHAVLVIGYGTTTNGDDYWLIKNSWGPQWGGKGFMWLQRNSPHPYGKCQIARQALYPFKLRRTTPSDDAAKPY